MARSLCPLALLLGILLPGYSSAQPLAPVLKSVFPLGVAAGQSIEVQISGDRLAGVSSLQASDPAITFEHLEGMRFRMAAAADAKPGLYQVRAISAAGVSSARTVFVTRRNLVLEASGKVGDQAEPVVQSVSDNSVISGRIEKSGDVDRYRFSARKGQAFVIECWADRVDSQLRAVAAIHDQSGRRLASNRGFFGVDPALRFVAPADGEYDVHLFDLIYSGGAEHFYRLDIGTGPRVVSVFPPAAPLGATTRATLVGWNLNSDLDASKISNNYSLESLDVQIETPAAPQPIPLHQSSQQLGWRGCGYWFNGADAPVAIGAAEHELLTNDLANQTMDSATPLPIPADVCGVWRSGNQQHWYALDLRQGETLQFVGRGQRLGSPVDLDIRILDERTELAALRDSLDNPGGLRFPVGHLDSVGTWTAPRDGRFYVLVRNLFTGAANDPRRNYWLQVVRHVPEADVVALARPISGPGAAVVRRGGHAVVDLLAVRRGETGSIRVKAEGLPAGVRCEPVWIGPHVQMAPLILTAEETAAPFNGQLQLVAEHRVGGQWRSRPVNAGEMISGGYPTGRGRLASQTSLAVVGEKAPLQVDAQLRRERFQQGSIVDIDVNLRRVRVEHSAEAKLRVVGLPPGVRPVRTILEAGNPEAVISVYLPPELPVGHYSFTVQVETTALPATKKKGEKPQGLTAFSNVVSFEVYPAPFVLAVDLDAPRVIHRGETIQLKYTAKRKNGFIGKIHTEMAAPGKVEGLRVRGVTFVGQTETGTLQIIANPDAPLGQQPFLRLEGVGTVEDEPIYLGSVFLNLEIIE